MSLIRANPDTGGTDIAFGMTKDNFGTMTDIQRAVCVEEEDVYLGAVRVCVDDGREEYYVRGEAAPRYMQARNAAGSWKAAKQIEVSNDRTFMLPDDNGLLLFEVGESYTIEATIRFNSFELYNVIMGSSVLSTNNNSEMWWYLSTASKNVVIRDWDASVGHFISVGNFSDVQLNTWYDISLSVDRVNNRAFAHIDGNFLGAATLPSSLAAAQHNYGSGGHLLFKSAQAGGGSQWNYSAYKTNPYGGGISAKRFRVTAALRYAEGVDYTVPERFLPFRQSLFARNFNNVVFLFDAQVSQGEFRDLTGRHTIHTHGNVTIDPDLGATTPIGTANYLNVTDNLEDFVFENNTPFEVEAIYLYADAVNQPVTGNRVYGLNISAELWNGTDMWGENPADTLLWLSAVNVARTGESNFPQSMARGVATYYLVSSDIPAMSAWNQIDGVVWDKMWVRVSWVSDGSTIRSYVNGQRIANGSAIDKAVLANTVNGLFIGNPPAGKSDVGNVHLRYLRIVKGEIPDAVKNNPENVIPSSNGFDLNEGAL